MLKQTNNANGLLPLVPSNVVRTKLWHDQLRLGKFPGCKCLVQIPTCVSAHLRGRPSWSQWFTEVQKQYNDVWTNRYLGRSHGCDAENADGWHWLTLLKLPSACGQFENTRAPSLEFWRNSWTHHMWILHESSQWPFSFYSLFLVCFSFWAQPVSSMNCSWIDVPPNCSSWFPARIQRPILEELRAVVQCGSLCSSCGLHPVPVVGNDLNTFVPREPPATNLFRCAKVAVKRRALSNRSKNCEKKEKAWLGGNGGSLLIESSRALLHFSTSFVGQGQGW